MNAKDEYDLLVIGGGINGTAIAADAAGRGLKVLLCEAEDLASATSSASSKLIHGGLRYLEQLHFHLVRESLQEREILLKKAPHNIKPLRFIMPNNPKLRSPWLIKLGLFLYDRIGGKQSLPKSETLNFQNTPLRKLFKNTFNMGFSYYDCWTDDARLVILNALCAKENGAKIMTRTRFIQGFRQNKLWHIQLEDTLHQKNLSIRSKAIVNAAGPWADQILTQSLGLEKKAHIQWVKGSHIIVSRLCSIPEAFILQNPDKRVIFIIPYLEHYHLIGTTDVKFQGDLRHCQITEAEIAYLLDSVNQYLQTPLHRTQIVNSYSGVRALATNHHEDPSEISRQYQLDLIDEDGDYPLLSVYGGKITTHRHLAETALNKLQKYFPAMQSAWTHNTPLPGGDILNADFDSFLEAVQKEYSALDKGLILRYAHQFGTRIHQLLKHQNDPRVLGEKIGGELYECELNYLIEVEWAQSAEDILWRRTKLGYQFPTDQLKKLNERIQKLRKKEILL